MSNDPIVDIVEVDDLGKPIIGSEAQMKFVGSSPKKLLDKLKSKKYAKYRDADVSMVIPDDYYDVLMGDGLTASTNRYENFRASWMEVGLPARILRLFSSKSMI